MTALLPGIAAALRLQQTSSRIVVESAEFRRIHALPRRTHVELHTELLHEALRLPGSAAQLLPAQVWALQEAMLNRGLIAPLPVGVGKTLLSFLIPAVVEAQRPLVLVPGGTLKRKTPSELAYWKKHFRIPENLRFLSYEKLARMKQEGFLRTYQPDCVVADECQWLRNDDSAAHRRFARHLEEFPGAHMYLFTGTLMPRSLRQGYRLSWWALRERSPLPHSWKDISDWADCVDENIKFDSKLRPHPGALRKFCADDETIKQGLERRLQETPGWVFVDSPDVRSSLTVEQVDLEVPTEVVKAFETLRKGRTPDGEVIVRGLDLMRHAFELISYNLYYRWKWPEDFPKAKKDAWLKARRIWRSFARDTIKAETVRGRNFDTEMQVAQACITGFLDDRVLDEETGEEVRAYADWVAIRDTADPETEAVWVSEYMLDFVEKWLKAPQSIAWVDNNAFLEKLRERGVLCFGGGDEGIVDEALSLAPRSCALSAPAHGTGKNLQGDKNRDAPGYFRNLHLAPGNGEEWEQRLGRTHRQGQEADCVENYVVLACIEQWRSFKTAQLDAMNVYRDGRGQRQKLIYADVSVDSEDEIENKVGPLWDDGRTKR